jgi:hypothetical protein
MGGVHSGDGLMATFNLHKVLAEAPRSDDFLSALEVADSQKRELRDARDLIRETLRAGFSSWQTTVERRVLLQETALKRAVPDPKLKPKFRMQGSASYYTLNMPAHHPPQRIDYDDGMYLPVSFLAETGSPVVASAGFFRLVEALLAPLCERKGWELRQKPSCVRVQLSKKAHIDLPLYAIPDDEFETLVEKSAIAYSAADRALVQDSMALDERIYEGLQIDDIRLAHREKGWIKSDPRLIERWFKDAIETHGYQLRRVCRYFKAWRDHHWDICVLSSITIMKCVVDAFDELRGVMDPKRDDLAVLEVAIRLSAYFAGQIENPVVDGILNDNWSEADRRAFIARAGDLHTQINSAIRGTDSAAVALSEFTRAFGSRIPQDVSLVIATAEATVRSFQPTKVPARQVPKTTSG